MYISWTDRPELKYNDMLKSIKSLKNPLVKKIILLQDKARDRKESGLFIIEGAREIHMAVAGGFDIETLLFAEHMSTYFDAEKLCLHAAHKPEIIEISREVHLRLAIRESTEPFLAIVKMKKQELSDLHFPPDKPVLILVAEAPEKPGNIGALLRTADGAGVDVVIIADPKTDLYNPNIIRSSLGCIFAMPVYSGTSENIVSFLQQNEIKIYSASLEASKLYTDVIYSKRTAIVVGAEDKGLTEIWTKSGDQNIIIPMFGKVDSLNVSVSTGILLYEVVRQKK